MQQPKESECFAGRKINAARISYHNTSSGRALSDGTNAFPSKKKNVCTGFFSRKFARREWYFSVTNRWIVLGKNVPRNSGMKEKIFFLHSFLHFWRTKFARFKFLPKTKIVDNSQKKHYKNEIKQTFCNFYNGKMN